MKGEPVALSEYLGEHVILLDFWATYCQPCLQAMPSLERLYQRHAERGFVVLGINIDGPESIAQVRTEVAKLGITFPILLDQDTETLAAYNPKSNVPFSILIGRDARVLARYEGYRPKDVESLSSDVERALGP
jgi:thiol-disulfide isomerase/thioredoxin